VIMTGTEQELFKPQPVALRSVLILMAFSIFINYIDRANFSIIAPLLKDELHISASQLGFLLSAFFWTYALATMLSGWLIDRVEPGWALACGFLLWSAATAATGLVYGFTGLFLVRLVLGVGAAVALPVYSRIIAKHISIQRRGVANSCIAAGVALGPAAVAYAGGPLVARFGWRPCFMALGLVSLIWLFPWLRVMPRGCGIVSANSGPVPNTAQILMQRSAWGTFLGLFCGQYYSYFLITWLPYYLMRQRGFSTEAMATTAGAAFLGMAVSALLAGWLSDRWIERGASPTLVRKTLTGGGLGLASVIAFVPLSSPPVSIALLVLACMSFGACYSNTWAVTQTIAGPHAVARWSGFKNFFGNLAGIVAPIVTGFLVDRNGQFAQAFLVVAGFALLGGVAWAFLVGGVRPIKWQAS
jgi:ACS family D-galactonate transporter-like MFS transporter